MTPERIDELHKLTIELDNAQDIIDILHNTSSADLSYIRFSTRTDLIAIPKSIKQDIWNCILEAYQTRELEILHILENVHEYDD